MLSALLLTDEVLHLLGTCRSTLSAAPSSAQQNAEGEDGEENDDCDVESQNHAEAAAAAQAIPMNDTQRPASLNSGRL